MKNYQMNQNNPPSNNTKQPKRPKLDMRWILFALLALLALQYTSQLFNTYPKDISWTQFKTDVLEEGQVDKLVVINKEKAEAYLKPSVLQQENTFSDIDSTHRGPQYAFRLGSLENFEEAVNQAEQEPYAGSSIDVEYVQRTNWWNTILVWVLPFLIIIGIWMWITRRARQSAFGGGSGGILNFGKANPDLKKENIDIDFDDVAGLEEVKVEVKEIVDFLKEPEKYPRLGAKIPKGVLLVGPPGTGKTLLAKAVAGEADVPFYSMSGSEFVEMFVGVGASRVRDLFKKAKENAPSIIFIDEIDAIGQTRGKSNSLQSNDERENTLNQLLTEMDGFGTNTGVVVMAASNRGEVLDQALLRPGRFDRQIYLDLPTLNERKAIFKVHLEPLKLGEDIDHEVLSKQTPGFSGADIANLCNEAALIAARRNQDEICMKDFYDATDRIIAGLKNKSRIINEKEKEIIAYHEAGHATVSWFLPNADNLLKVSIVPRGKSLGAAWYLPQENHLYTKAQLVDKICAALGGRAAEEVMFKEISSGALNDLEKVTKQAYAMVAHYGLDEEFGNVSFHDSTGRQNSVFQKPYSDATAEKIDKRVQQLIEHAYERTKSLLIKHQDQLEELAELLLEKEVVFKKDLEKIFGAMENTAPTNRTLIKKI
jgi:cell division protease FtsH